jgi:hypothetical protein
VLPTIEGEADDLNLNEPPKLEFFLPIPEENTTVLDGQKIIYYTPDQFKLTLKIFQAHYTASVMFPMLVEQIELAKEETGLVYLQLRNCIEVAQEVNEEREELHILRDQDIKNYKQDIRNEKIKAILIGAGAGLVGIAGGIVIGFFAIR